MKLLASRQGLPARCDILALLLLLGGLLWLRRTGLKQEALDAAVAAALRLFDADDGFLTLS